MVEGTILLNYQEDTRQVEAEEKSRFLRGILEHCFQDIPEMLQQVSEVWGETIGDLPVEQKIKLRNLLANNSLQVIDDLDGRLKIYLENDLIGEWDKVKYCLRKDLQVKDPKKRIFLEMNIKCWTCFDEEETQES